MFKKCKKARTIDHYFTVSLGMASVALSSSWLASALTGVGIVVGAPLGAVGAFCGAASTALAAFNKKLEKKMVEKHAKVHALAIAKHDSVKGCVSVVIDDNKVSDEEFRTVLREIERYRRSKNGQRLKYMANKPALPQRPQPDVEEIRKEIRCGSCPKSNSLVNTHALLGFCRMI